MRQKYKICDFTTGLYFPRSTGIFIPTCAGVFNILETLEEQNHITKASCQIYLFDATARENSPNKFMFYEEFVSYAANQNEDLDWCN